MHIAETKPQDVADRQEQSWGLYNSGNPNDPTETPQPDPKLCPEKLHRWVNRQITRAAGTGDITLLLDVVQTHATRMNLINASTALHRTARLMLGSTAPFREWLLEQGSLAGLQGVVLRHVAQLEARVSSVAMPPSRFQPQMSIEAGHTEEGHNRANEMRCLSIICWSCATLRLREEKMFGAVARVSQNRFGELKPFELSNMLWAYAKLNCCSDALIEGVAPHLLNRREGHFGSQCLSTIIWSLGTMKANLPVVFNSFSEEITATAGAISPQGIANTAWAFARVRRQDASLFKALAGAACRDNVIWAFKPQELSNMTWAFATVGLPHTRLFDRVADVAISRRADLPPQNVANIIWAYAKLLMNARKRLFPMLLEVAATMLVKYKPQEVSAVLWAAAREECAACRDFFSAVPPVFESRLSEFTSQALACMVEAFALAMPSTAGLATFFARAVAESLSRLESFQPPSLCTLFRGIALDTLNSQSSLDRERNLRTMCEHLIVHALEMRAHNVAHVNQTLEMLDQGGCSEPCLRQLATSPVFSQWSDRPSVTLASSASYDRPSYAATNSSFGYAADGLSMRSTNMTSRTARRKDDRALQNGQVRRETSRIAFDIDDELASMVLESPEATMEDVEVGCGNSGGQTQAKVGVAGCSGRSPPSRASYGCGPGNGAHRGQGGGPHGGNNPVPARQHVRSKINNVGGEIWGYAGGQYGGHRDIGLDGGRDGGHIGCRDGGGRDGGSDCGYPDRAHGNRPLGPVGPPGLEPPGLGLGFLSPGPAGAYVPGHAGAHDDRIKPQMYKSAPPLSSHDDYDFESPLASASSAMYWLNSGCQLDQSLVDDACGAKVFRLEAPTMRNAKADTSWEPPPMLRMGNFPQASGGASYQFIPPPYTCGTSESMSPSDALAISDFAEF